MGVEEETILRVTNQDPNTNLSLDCTFENTRALSVTCEPHVLAPGEFVDVPFKFTPREQRDFGFTVPFIVNGSSMVNVAVIGNGIPARLELVNPSNILLPFGAVPEGNDLAKQVKLVNRSKRQLQFELIDPMHLGQGRLEAQDIFVAPAVPTILGPRESVLVEVRFAPQKRLESFSEDLLVRYCGHEKKLLAVTGSSTGMDVALETDTLSFGTVCTGSLVSKKLVLENSGDLPANYHWQVASFGQHFSISPREGMVAPGSEVAFEVTFQPNRVDEDIRVEGIRPFVDGTNPLLLTCLGACVPQPDDTISELTSDGIARKAEVKQISIKNPTDKPWFLSPILTGDHWNCESEVKVPAGSTINFDVTYFPLCMTYGMGPPAEGSEEPADLPPLEGSLFFALPDGTALLYKLRGVANKPEAESVTEVSTPAKKIKDIRLPVKNWLERPQRMRVDMKLDEGTDAASTKLEGTQTVDLVPSGTYEYVVKFKAFKEGLCGARITFTNLETKEYLFHDIKVTVEESNTLEVIKLEAPLRQTTRHLITVDNPLAASAPVTFSGGDEEGGWWTCPDPTVRLTRVGEMQGNKEGTFQLEYRPLRNMRPEEAATGESGGKPFKEVPLEFRIDELGSYKYTLQLTPMPPTAEPTLRFEAPLGASQTETFTFRAFNRSAVTFQCSVSQPMFFQVVEPTKSVEACAQWEGHDVKVQVVSSLRSSETSTTCSSSMMIQPESTGFDWLVCVGGRNHRDHLMCQEAVVRISQSAMCLLQTASICSLSTILPSRLEHQKLLSKLRIVQTAPSNMH